MARRLGNVDELGSLVVIHKKGSAGVYVHSDEHRKSEKGNAAARKVSHRLVHERSDRNDSAYIGADIVEGNKTVLQTVILVGCVGPGEEEEGAGKHHDRVYRMSLDLVTEKAHKKNYRKEDEGHDKQHIHNMHI